MMAWVIFGEGFPLAELFVWALSGLGDVYGQLLDSSASVKVFQMLARDTYYV